MRIGVIIYGDLDILSGGYLYDRMMVEGLTGLGHEVEVIGLRSGSYLKRLAQAFSPWLCGQLMAGEYDILIEDELCHPSLFHVNGRLRRNGGPLLVALVHHTLCEEPRSRWHNRALAAAERWFLSSVDGCIYNSRSTRQSVRSLLDRDLPGVIAYPSGGRFGSPLSPEAMSKRSRQPGPLELLFLGNVVPRKGLLPLLEALAGVDRSWWRLSIVGGLEADPVHVCQVKSLVGRLGLSDSVLFLGQLRDDELVEILGRSHILCMPYAYEGFGIAILDGMAFGLPAIGCRNGGAGETISHGINGFLLSPDDRAGLEPLLAKLHRDRKLLQELALAARETYEGSPTWRDSAAAIDLFLKALPGLAERENVARAPGQPGM